MEIKPADAHVFHHHLIREQQTTQNDIKGKEIKKENLKQTLY